MKKAWKILEWAAAAAVMHYCISLFLSNSSTFRMLFTSFHKYILFGSVVVLGVARFIWGAVQEIRERKDGRELLRVALRAVFVAFAIVVCTLITQRFGYTFMVYLPFAALCLYGANAEKVLKAFTWVLGTMLAMTVLCALSGAIRNLIYLRKGTYGSMRGSYGICYPTDLAAYLVFFLVMLFACMRKNSRSRSVFLIILSLLAAWWIHDYTDSRNSMICAVLVAVVILYDLLETKALSGHKGTKWIGKTIDGLAVAAFPLLGAGMMGLTWLYGQGNAFATRVNELLSDRLATTWAAVQKYGIQLLGALTPQAGRGGKLIYTSEVYEFLDSTYALLLIRYGLIFTVIVACLWVWTTRKALRTGHRRIALAMAVIAVHSFTEHHFPELNFNILLAMPFCAFIPRPETAEEPAAEQRIAEKRRKIAGWVVGGGLAVAIILLLPWMLSLARYLFALKGWRNAADWAPDGTQVLGAMFYWLVCIGAWVTLWFALRRGLTELMTKQEVSDRVLIGLIAVLFLFVGGMNWMNTQIIDGQGMYAKQMDADAEAVEKVLAAAEEPVYAGQMEELYKRRFGGIRGRIFSPEELGRTGKGSILLENENEAYQLLNTGAKYTELTPYTGLFTYDEAVIRQMSEAGYEFKDYFSAEREMDMEVYSWDQWINGRKRHLILRGPYEEQYAGSYEVTWDLRLIRNSDVTDDEQEICLVRAVSLFGEEILAERSVKAGEFDADGRASVTLEYRTGSTRGVEYRVYVTGEVKGRVKKVGWKQISK